jgi:hypothetical protein
MILDRPAIFFCNVGVVKGVESDEQIRLVAPNETPQGRAEGRISRPPLDQGPAGLHPPLSDMQLRLALDGPMTAIYVRITMIVVSLAVGAEVFLVR